MSVTYSSIFYFNYSFVHGPHAVYIELSSIILLGLPWREYIIRWVSTIGGLQFTLNLITNSFFLFLFSLFFRQIDLFELDTTLGYMKFCAFRVLNFIETSIDSEDNHQPPKYTQKKKSNRFCKYNWKREPDYIWENKPMEELDS